MRWLTLFTVLNTEILLRCILTNATKMTKECVFFLEITRQEDPALSYSHEWICKLDSADAYGNKYTDASLNLKDVQLDEAGIDREGRQVLVSGETILKPGNELSSGIIKINSGSIPQISRRIHVVHNNLRSKKRQTQTEARPNDEKKELSVLAVRVIDKLDEETDVSTDELSDSIFGTYGDDVNLKSQISACSYDSVTIVPAVSKKGKNNIKNGVITVSINSIVSGSDVKTIQSDVSNALSEELGGCELPCSYDHIMYCFPRGARRNMSYMWTGEKHIFLVSIMVR